ncbi:hypothetical protein H4R34_002799 [Dimargaris verticillata]|uniref:Uncharacterized protein n=1 Tax=Dimargaris verticillata TaxID=2761393 RepID=A0A9W8ECK8_9FUNG|nr:hypothetical protein H4R34_002799 [Dimargaris verticillata]
MVSLLYLWANLAALPWVLAVNSLTDGGYNFDASGSPVFGGAKEAHLEDLERFLAEEPYGDDYSLTDPRFQGSLQQVLGWLSSSQGPRAHVGANPASGMPVVLSGPSGHTQTLGEITGSRYYQACRQKMRDVASYTQFSESPQAPAPYDAKKSKTYWKSKSLWYGMWVAQKGKLSPAELHTPQLASLYEVAQAVNAMTLGDYIMVLEYNANSQAFHLQLLYDPVNTNIEQCTQGALWINAPHVLPNFVYTTRNLFSAEMFAEGQATFSRFVSSVLIKQSIKDPSLSWIAQLAALA